MCELHRRSLLATGGALVGAGILDRLTDDRTDPEPNDQPWLYEAITRSDHLAEAFVVAQPEEIAGESENERIGLTGMGEIAATYLDLGFRRVDEILLIPPTDLSVSVVTGVCDRSEFLAAVGATGRLQGSQGEYGLYHTDTFGTVAVSDHAVIVQLDKQPPEAIADLRAFLRTCSDRRLATGQNPLRELYSVLPTDYDTFFGGRQQRNECCQTLGIDPDLVLAGASTNRTEDGTMISEAAVIFKSEARVDLDHIRENNMYAEFDFDEPYAVSREGRVVSITKHRDMSIYEDGLFDGIDWD